LWGVYRFKEGFGGEVVRHIGAWDFPANPLLYPLYTSVLPRILDWLRWKGKERTRRLVVG
jgi:lipid II:glycine glycyltransferase (peptidoglycan interpeptide bridge formation enzyme)